MFLLKNNFCRKSIPLVTRRAEIIIFRSKWLQFFVKSKFFQKVMPLKVRLYAINRCNDFFSLNENLKEIFVVYGKTGRRCVVPNKLNLFNISLPKKVDGCSIYIAPLESNKIYSLNF